MSEGAERRPFSTVDGPDGGTSDVGEDEAPDLEFSRFSAHCEGGLGRSLWDAGWAVGVPWALWHLPVVLILFAQQGMEPILMLTSFVGFGIGIVAMSILHTWFYANTKSVFLAIVIHAAFNTVPLAAGFMLASGSYFTAVASQLSLWAVVIFITKRAERAEAATVLPP